MEQNELDSTCGISDDELTERFKESIRIDNEIRRIKGLPVAKYDSESRCAYLEYPDGRIEYVEDENTVARMESELAVNTSDAQRFQNVDDLFSELETE
jgi:hypothetical protein